jgi:hypothetical protein
MMRGRNSLVSTECHIEYDDMVQEVSFTLGGSGQICSWFTPTLNIGRSCIRILLGQLDLANIRHMVTHSNIVGYVRRVTRPEVNIYTARSDKSASRYPIVQVTHACISLHMAYQPPPAVLTWAPKLSTPNVLFPPIIVPQPVLPSTYAEQVVLSISPVM